MGTILKISTFWILFFVFNTLCIIDSLTHGEGDITEVHKGHRNSSKQFKTEIHLRRHSCRPRHERKCTLVFSRHHESDAQMRWIDRLDRNIRRIVMNSGDAVASDHNFCEHRVWANVGREAYKYITYILENYLQPDNFSPITVFCQMSTEAPGYSQKNFVDDVHNLCLRDGKPNMLRWGFLYLGKYVLDFHKGFQVFPNYDYERDFKALFNTSTTEPVKMQFVPTGCFAVSKANILSQPMEYYAKLLTYGNLNSINNPMIGHVFERSWSRIMNSECERKIPWCCHTECNTTSVL